MLTITDIVHHENTCLASLGWTPREVWRLVDGRINASASDAVATNISPMSNSPQEKGIAAPRYAWQAEDKGEVHGCDRFYASIFV